MLRDIDLLATKLSKIDGFGDLDTYLAKIVNNKDIKEAKPEPKVETPKVETPKDEVEEGESQKKEPSQNGEKQAAKEAGESAQGDKETVDKGATVVEEKAEDGEKK